MIFALIYSALYNLFKGYQLNELESAKSIMLNAIILYLIIFLGLWKTINKVLLKKRVTNKILSILYFTLILFSVFYFGRIFNIVGNQIKFSRYKYKLTKIVDLINDANYFQSLRINQNSISVNGIEHNINTLKKEINTTKLNSNEIESIFIILDFLIKNEFEGFFYSSLKKHIQVIVWESVHGSFSYIWYENVNNNLTKMKSLVNYFNPIYLGDGWIVWINN